MSGRKGVSGAASLAATANRVNAAASSNVPTPPASLTPAEREHFLNLLDSKSNDYWRLSDGPQLTRFVTLWTRAMKAADDAATARPCTAEGRPNPIFALEARLFRQAELMLRSLGLTAFQRLENRGGGGAGAREAKRADERSRAVQRSQQGSGTLLAPPMHEAPPTKQ